MQGKFRSLGSLLVQLVSIFVILVSSSLASAEKFALYLSKESTRDPESGLPFAKYWNPGGQVDITFGESSINVAFEDVDGKPQKIRVFMEFDPPPMQKGGVIDPEHMAMFERAKDRGLVLGMQILKEYLNRIGGLGAPALMILDSKGSMGFTSSDYDSRKVTLVSPITEARTLSAVVMQLVRGELEQLQSAHEAKLRARQLPAEGLYRNPLEIKEIRVRYGGTCEALFRPVAQ